MLTSDLLQSAITAVHAARSIIAASARGSEVLQYCAAQLVPSLVDCAFSATDDLLDEALKTLAVFLDGVPKGYRKL